MAKWRLTGWNKRELSHLLHETDCKCVTCIAFDSGADAMLPAVLTYLESQLFRKEPLPDEVCHLTYDMWVTIKKDLLEEKK